MGERNKDKERERDIYMFVSQMKEKVYSEFLNSFRQVKKSGVETGHNTGLFFFNYSKFIWDIAAC